MCDRGGSEGRARCPQRKLFDPRRVDAPVFATVCKYRPLKLTFTRGGLDRVRGGATGRQRPQSTCRRPLGRTCASEERRVACAARRGVSVLKSCVSHRRDGTVNGAVASPTTTRRGTAGTHNPTTAMPSLPTPHRGTAGTHYFSVAMWKLSLY